MHLKYVAQSGYIELMYLDESGCQLWSPRYSYRGRTKRIEQTDDVTDGSAGVWQPDRSFSMHLCGSFKSESYIARYRLIAEQTSETLGQLDG